MVEYQRSSLFDWVEDVILASKLHSRSDWALLCGVPEATIERWLNQELIPSPRSLRALHIAISCSPNQKAKYLYELWLAMETKTLLEVAPSYIPEINMPLGKYALQWDLANLSEAMSLLSYSEQEEVLGSAIQKATNIWTRNLRAAQAAEISLKVTVRFFGQLNSINDSPKSWDYLVEYSSHEEAGEAIRDYLATHDDGIANYEVV